MMKRNVSEVRRSFAKRRAEKLMSIQNRSLGRPNKPVEPATHSSQKQTSDRAPVFVKQLIASAIIFLGVYFMTQFTPLTSTAGQWFRSQIREDFPFATVNVWYQEQFGSPLGFFIEDTPVPVSNQQAIPVHGNINHDYDLNGQGVMIETDDQPEVYAIDQGTVLFAGNDAQTQKTVVIQHPDRTKSTYGFLAEIDVRPYQFVQASQKIGMTSSDSPVYFSVQKGHDYIDPVEVITVNEQE